MVNKRLFSSFFFAACVLKLKHVVHLLSEFIFFTHISTILQELCKNRLYLFQFFRKLVAYFYFSENGFTHSIFDSLSFTTFCMCDKIVLKMRKCLKL